MNREVPTVLYPSAKLSDSDFISTWNRILNRLDYKGRRHLLWTKLTPPMPRFLYKYRALDQTNSRSREALREILIESVMRMAAPIEFNDPFDMSARFTVEGTPQQLRAKFEELARIYACAGVTPQQHALAVARLREEMEKIGRASLARFRERTGIYCFAGSPRSTLMWGHYARDHTGVCLQFERAHDHHVLLHALRVRYHTDYPSVNWIAGDVQNQISSALFAKDPEWKYERESRIIALEQAGKYLHLRPEALRAIILGCRATPYVISTVTELLAERAKLGRPAARVYQAQMHASKYQLVIRKRP